MTDLAGFGAVENATYADLQQLAARRVREGMRLEFKAQLRPFNDKARFELIKDVSAFANTQGGILVYGVSQHPDGSIAELSGLTLEDEDATLNQVSSIIEDNIEERIPGISIRVIRSDGGDAFVLIRVPRSSQAPHMLTMPVTHPRFYYRANSLNAPMTTAQVKRASLAGKEREDDLLNLIDRRARSEDKGESSLQVFALPLYSESYSLDITREAIIRELMNVSGFMGGGQAGHSLAGYVVRYVGQTHRKHVLFMRDGGVEIFDAPLARRNASGVLVVSLHVVERRCLQLVEALSQARVDGLGALPFLFAVRLAGVRGARYEGAWYSEGEPCSDDIVFPEPEVVHDWKASGQSLKRIFDVLWQSFGVPGSPNYDETGSRKSQ